ncbi:SH3 domain-containing protein [Streptomyces sp. MBT97]|uniref:SH3 domain-containing protein n=1 Tax=Streptomyces sp. MBT97 TaxID=2800411 RepID=UPI00190B8EFC|nr:SH3 domain-containing protein [Streptomyces sp. MBT97]MBK3637975.1 SH3 domain-containing protein [Streptomyces sp. MBT97]
MRTTVALRTPAVALLAGGTLAVASLGTTAEARPAGRGDGDGSVRGTVVSRTELNVRQEPTTHSPVVAALAPGSHDRVQCRVKGQSVDGNPDWYWLFDAQGWASAALVDTGGARVPDCADPCPRWKNGDWTNWDAPFPDSPSGVTVSGTFSFSGSWSFTVGTASDTSSGDWEWVPVGR